MPTSNWGWQNGWFYLRNDGGLLPEYTGKMVVECPEKCAWGALAEEQKRLSPLLAGLEKLRQARVTAATVAMAFHKRSLLPLVQRRAFMWKMTRADAGGASVGDGHNHPGLEDHAPGSEGFPGGADAPREGLHFSGKPPLLSLILRSFPFFLALALIASRSQGMGIIKDSLPPVPEDKELRAKNRAWNEEQKKAKEDKKVKSARKAQCHEIVDKNRREAEKNRRPPRGLRHQGARESPPTLLWMMKRTVPHERALSTQVPRRGRGRQAVDQKCPHNRRCRRARLSPAQRLGRRWEARPRRREPRPLSKPPRQPLGRRGSTQRPSALREALRELRASRRVLPPGQGTYWLLDLSFDFLFFSFF